MKAIICKKYGSPEILELQEVEKPIPNENEVLVKVHAVSVNDWDWGNLIGTQLITRLIFGLFKPKKSILGSDIAGVVEEAGKNVKSFKPGDEIYGDLSGEWGGFAEYVCARENVLALKPACMTFQQAAAIPQAAMLAIQGLEKGKTQIHPGKKILINGAGGGVGTFAIQIIRLKYDIEVTGVDSTEKLDILRSLGFDHVIDYTKEDFTKSGKSYDLILDVKTSRSVFDYARALNPGGIYISIGGSMARILQALLFAPLISRVSKKKIHILAFEPNKDLTYVNELFEAGKIKPVIDNLYSLNEVPQAMRYFGEGKHKGKVVITVENNLEITNEFK